MNSNTIDNYSNTSTNKINNINKMSSNIPTNKMNNINNIDKMASINNSPMTLREKLKRFAASKKKDTNASKKNDTADSYNLGDITKLAPSIGDISTIAHNFGENVSDVSKVFVDTSAEIASIGITTGENAAKVEAIATVNAADDLAQTAADMSKNKLPGIFDNLKDVTKVVTQGIGEVNNVIDTTSLEMEEAATNAQISTMMASRPGITEEQARNELINKENIEKEEVEKAIQLELENKRIEVKEAEAKAKEAEAEAKSKSGGGVIKNNSLKNIQKGGKMAAKRTQKSIKEFLNSSVTSSSILKLIKGGKRSIKKRKYNFGMQTKRRI